jgi:LacI family gluconate utilization system Gnt-I transcriptional repressor
MAQLIEQHPEVRAVFCSSDVLAIGAMIEAGARGFTVPQDIAIMGMGNQEFAASLDPPLTTVRIDGTRVGRTAAELIIRRAGGEEVEERVIDIGFQIIDRGSA